jgi:O-antigen ligase
MNTSSAHIQPAPSALELLQDRVAFWLLWALVFSIPCEEAFPLLAGFVVTRLLGLAAAVAVALRCILLGRFRKPGLVLWALAAFAAWGGTSILWSDAPESTLVRAGTYAQLLLLAWLVWEVVRSEQRAAGLLQAYVLGALVSASETVRNFAMGRTAGVLGAELGRDIQDGQRYTAGAFNVNDLGLVLVLSIPLSLYFLARTKRRAARYLYWTQLALCIAAVGFTASRGALIALTAALMAVPLTLRFFSRRARLAAAAIIPASLVVAALIIPPEARDRFLNIGTEFTKGTLTHRTEIWTVALDTYRERPLSGVGAGAFSETSARKLDRPLVAHNTFLAVLSELGTVGALLFATILGLLVACISGLPALEKRIWGVLLLAWAAGASGVTWEYRKPTWILFALLAAHASACTRERAREFAHRAVLIRKTAFANSWRRSAEVQR